MRYLVVLGCWASLFSGVAVAEGDTPKPDAVRLVSESNGQHLSARHSSELKRVLTRNEGAFARDPEGYQRRLSEDERDALRRQLHEITGGGLYESVADRPR